MKTQQAFIEIVFDLTFVVSARDAFELGRSRVEAEVGTGPGLPDAELASTSTTKRSDASRQKAVQGVGDMLEQGGMRLQAKDLLGELMLGVCWQCS